MKGVIVLLPFVVLPILAFLIYTGAVAVNRHNRFQEKENAIRLEKLKRQADLDLKLQEWQATASLEDLTRQRHRLETDLDDMHDVIPVYDTDGTRVIGYRRKENQK